MVCRADEHYEVIRSNMKPYEVTQLACKQCGFRVFRRDVSGAGLDGTGKNSGQPRYNRMRARMVKHIHAAHVRHDDDAVLKMAVEQAFGTVDGR